MAWKIGPAGKMVGHTAPARKIYFHNLHGIGSKSAFLTKCYYAYHREVAAFPVFAFRKIANST
jgi:hypothetical protein